MGDIDDLASRLVAALRAEANAQAQALTPGPEPVPLAVPTPPAPVAEISKVWVAVGVHQNVVAVENAGPAIQPLTGRGPNAIFDRPGRQTQTRLAAHIVAVTTSPEAAETAVEAHKHVLPGCDYQIVPVTIDDHPAATPATGGPGGKRCIVCGKPANATRCDPCQRAHWQKMRDLDPNLEEGTDQ